MNKSEARLAKIKLWLKEGKKPGLAFRHLTCEVCKKGQRSASSSRKDTMMSFDDETKKRSASLNKNGNTL